MKGEKVDMDLVEPVHTYGRICGRCCGATTVPINELKETNGLLVVVEGEGPALEEQVPPDTTLHREVVSTMEGPITIYWGMYEPSERE